MRFVKSLLMLLMLVTFSTGFGETTADLKQNSKTEFVAFDCIKAVTITSVSVVDQTMFVVPKNDCVTLYALIRDVGWQSKANHKQLAYKEKVMLTKDLYHKNQNQIKTNRIRKPNLFYNPETIFMIHRYS